MIYFKFSPSWRINKVRKSRLHDFFYIFIERVLSLLVPKANPDFDSIYDKVVIWLIEYDDAKDYVNREIGLDENLQPIVKGPYEKNLGFWVDSNMIYKDYLKFNIQVIKESYFEKYWQMDIKQ